MATNPQNKKRCEQPRVTHSVLSFAELSVAGQRLPPRRGLLLAVDVPSRQGFSKLPQDSVNAVICACAQFCERGAVEAPNVALCNTRGILPRSLSHVATSNTLLVLPPRFVCNDPPRHKHDARASGRNSQLHQPLAGASSKQFVEKVAWASCPCWKLRRNHSLEGRATSFQRAASCEIASRTTRRLSSRFHFSYCLP